MKIGPLVSVVVPTCFREAMLIDCVDSLVTQDYPDFEIIVVDQADERTLEGVLHARYPNDRRVRYLYSHRAGAAKARNLALAEARGSIAAFIDDDAIAAPGWVNAMVSALTCDAEPALVAGRIFPIWPKQRPDWFPKEREFLLGLYDLGDQRVPLPPADLPIGANMAGKRDVILAHGGFDETLGPNYFKGKKSPESDAAGNGKKQGHVLVQKAMIFGEEAIMGRRIRESGHPLFYEPTAVVRHRVSPKKLTRSYLLRRHFWEGVAVIKQMAILGQLGKARIPHYKFHLREIGMAAARLALPGYQNIYPQPHVVIRMSALARIAYACGVIYAISEKRAMPPAPPEKVKCASA
jgi:glycosyltransferase involved in cell wall biosynthesis